MKLEPREEAILDALSLQHPISIEQLKKLTGIYYEGVVKALGSLEEKGLTKRYREPGCKKSAILWLAI